MAVAGVEKLAHLEDKIHRTYELCKTLRQERDTATRELEVVRHDLNAVLVEKERLEAQVRRLAADRDAMRLKLEAMLDAIALLEMEAESGRK
ncbi:MAG: hypothetical protein ACKV2V_24060 [Blastocatellia bacterium]